MPVHHVAVLNRTDGLLHLHLFAKCIADAELETLEGNPDVRPVGEVRPVRIRVHLQLAARQRGDAGEGERQLVLEERAAETAHRRAKPGAPALQIILLGRCHDVEAQAELPRKRLLVACHHAGLPSGRVHPDLRTLQVGVRDAAVEVETRFGAGVPVEVGIQTRLLALDDIPVGRVQQILVVVEAILRDTVSGENSAGG